MPAGETRIVWIDGRFSWQYGPYQVWLQFDPPPPPSPSPPSPPPPAPPIEDVIAYVLANHNLGTAYSATVTGTLDGQLELGFGDGKEIMYAYTAPIFGTLSLQLCVEGYGFLNLLDDGAYPYVDETLAPVDGCTGTSGVLS